MFCSKYFCSKLPLPPFSSFHINPFDELLFPCGVTKQLLSCNLTSNFYFHFYLIFRGAEFQQNLVFFALSMFDFFMNIKPPQFRYCCVLIGLVNHFHICISCFHNLYSDQFSHARLGKWDSCVYTVCENILCTQGWPRGEHLKMIHNMLAMLGVGMDHHIV